MSTSDNRPDPGASEVPPCLICGGSRFNERDLGGGAFIRRCLDCGLWASRFGERDGSAHPVIDERAYADSIGRVRKAQGRAIVDFVREHGGGGEWLDVGCGPGYLLEAARDAGFAVRGIEPEPRAAAAARARFGDLVMQGFFDESVAPLDIVSTLDVIEHLPDVAAFAALVRGRARTLWVIKVPTSEGLFFRIAHSLRLRGATRRLWQADFVHPHKVYFDRATLTRFLDDHGFDVVATRYLDEIPTATAVDRLTLDGRLSRWAARLAVPAVAAVNVLERLRGRSDALVVLARARPFDR